MERMKQKSAVIRFLTISFIGIILFSILAFSFLGIFMTRKSHEAFHEIGKIYMSGISKQIASHFESVIRLRFNQVSGLVSVVSPDDRNQEELYEELAYRAEVREFDHLALCAPDGTFQSLYGKPIQPDNPGPFVEALVQREQRVAVGTDADGEKVILFGVDATSYPMKDGGMSTGIVAAVPLEYITDFLSLNRGDHMLSFCIVRNDGSYVINNSHIDFGSESDYLPELLSKCKDNSEVPYSATEFESALQSNRQYVADVMFNGNEHKIRSIPLSNSEWNLVAIMSYNELNNVMDTLNVRRTWATILACQSVVLLMLLVFVRYFQMSNAQIAELEESRRKAEEASKFKSEFLANMSHDIRTPMNAIVGMTAIATAHLNDGEQVKNCLRKIALSSKQLLGLINDVLDMSKIESGKMTLTMENTSMKEIFDGIVSIMQPQIDIKKQRFDVHVESIATENVWCDGVRLNQVLLNLLSNATKYTQEGGTICLSLSEENSPKGENFARFHIWVKDNGMGMTPEFLEKLYESYSRMDGARVQRIQGTGLGMTITKYIVDAMQGSIDVQSQLDKGTEFHLTFDFEKAPGMEMNMVLPAWRMLVVDDDEFLCKSTISALKGFGIQAEWTLSGENAIEMAVKRHAARDDYQIILLDWKLPGMDGIQVAKELRGKLGTEVPILLISAYDWSDFEAEAREAGIDGFISKPLFKSTLFYNLRKYMTEEERGEKEQQQEPSNSLDGCRILLAEDNELNWEIANDLLSEVGLQLEWAQDGQICLDMFQKAEVGYYDAILMDIRMPNMTGYEAATTIRALERPDAATIPIIAMSADAFSEDVQRCLKCGMNAHIAKPIDLTATVKKLEKYIKKHE